MKKKTMNNRNIKENKALGTRIASISILFKAVIFAAEKDPKG